MSSTVYKALAFINSIENALSNGVEHFDIRGNRLATPIQIIDALINDGKIVCQEPTSEQGSAIPTSQTPSATQDQESQ